MHLARFLRFRRNKDLFAGNLGEVLIRCNNVLFIRGAEEEDEEGETRD